ncbi:MAG: hypothetical protein AAGI11_20510 [Pseudomonadota bacterium]
MDNRRKTIVVNSRFQYQYSLASAALAVLLINLFLIARLVFPGDSPLALTTSSALIIGALEIAVIGMVWYGSLRQSHRIAGPVYVFAREITRLCNGDLGANIHLREQDMFTDTAEELNASFAVLKAKVEHIQSLVAELPDNTENQAVLTQLREAVAEFREIKS